METGLGSLLITWTYAFVMLMVRPKCLLVTWTKSTRVWMSAADSAVNAISSEKRRVFTVDPFTLRPMLESSIAVVITSSRRMLNSWWERMHPCLTPVSVWNQSVKSLSTLTALSRFCKVIEKILYLRWVSQMLHCSPKALLPKSVKCFLIVDIA